MRLARAVPALAWLGAYRRGDLSGDLVAGTITAILLVPQAMAYSLLAGLPPEVGLYASIAPPILYALFGSSRTMAVGPVAVASLMVANALAAIAPAGSAEYYAGALVLAALVGLILTAMGLARVGFVANFLSHPVMSGFTSAAAIVIALSQLKHLLGLEIPSALRTDQILTFALEHAASINLAALAIGGTSLVALILIRSRFATFLSWLGLSEGVVGPLSKTGPLMVVVLGTAAAAAFGLARSAGLSVVGGIPSGLPPLTVPVLDLPMWRELASSALLIALVSFIESIAIAKVLASKRRQKIDPDQELIGLGIANLGAGFTGGSPVCGGFSRSVVNFTAGANTQLAAIVTASLIALTVLFFTPLFYHLPQAVLAAIIVLSVLGLFDLHTLRQTWRYDKADAFAWLATFAVVLVEGIEAGLIAGVAVSIVLYLWRTSRPHMAVVGRVGSSEHFRNVLRHPVRIWPNLLLIRVDESLYFANTRYLEDHLLAAVAEQERVEHVVLICSAVNFIDASALESLENLIAELRSAGVTLHLAEVKGPVTDRLARSDFFATLAPGRIFLSTHDAVGALAADAPSTRMRLQTTPLRQAG
ncbi:MAG TPA: solute carrier family 26 protein [Geminicoccaceae bacterium]